VADSVPRSHPASMTVFYLVQHAEKQHLE